MKKYILTVLTACFLLMTNDSKAQTKEQILKSIVADSAKQAKTLIRTLNDIKSGNWQDVLTNFFQIGLSDLSGTKRSLEFKANLFALKAKADSTLLVDTNYVKQSFARNFQFNFALKLDSQYRFSGLKAGFTLALINKRDSSVLSLVKTPADAYFVLFMDSLQFVFNRFNRSLRKPGNLFKSEEDSLLFLKTKNIVDALLEAGLFDSKLLPKEFLKFANFQIIDKNFRVFDSLFNAELRKLRQRPLLTLSANGTFSDQRGLFSEGKAEVIYLQGLTKKGRNLEMDLRDRKSVV